MQKIISFLKGKKSYIVAAVTLAYGFYQAHGLHDWRSIVPFILASGYGAAIRAAIAKAENGQSS